ncbi:MAG: nucleotide exchange factor GrpE [Erysipelotrichaceae bacterium]
MDQNKEETVVETTDSTVNHDEQVVELSVEEQLNARIEELEKEVATTKNAYFKAYADTENLKKRLLTESENTKKYRIQSFALEVLPVIDNLERALDNLPEEEALRNYLAGFKMIYDQLNAALQKEGVVEMDALNQPFDPNKHQALMQESVEGVEPNMVVEVLQKGYMLKDRILRCALVKVSA